MLGWLTLFAAVPAAAQGGGETEEDDDCEANTICEEITVTGENWQIPQSDIGSPPGGGSPPTGSDSNPTTPPQQPAPIIPTMRPETEEDRQAERKRQQEEEDRRIARCTMYATSLSALNDQFEDRGCNRVILSRDKRRACRSLGAEIQALTAKVVACNN